MNSYGGNAPVEGGVQQAGDLTVAEYRAKHDMTVLGQNCPDPFQSFQSVGFPPDIMDEVFRTWRLKSCALQNRGSPRTGVAASPSCYLWPASTPLGVLAR